MAYTGARMPKLVICHIRFAALATSRTSLHKQKSSEEDAGYLAGFAYCH